MNLQDQGYQLPTEVVQLLSAEQAHEYQVIPIREVQDSLHLKSAKTEAAFKSELEILLGKPIVLEYESEEHIKGFLSTNYRLNNSSGVSTLNYSNDFLDKLLNTAKSILEAVGNT